MKILAIVLAVGVLFIAAMYFLDLMVDEWWPDDEEDDDFGSPDDWNE